jgi:hypothetical protein
MGETYWERRRRHLNEDHAARRAESNRTIGLICSQEKIDRLTAAIGTAAGTPANTPDPSLSEEFRRLGVEWMMKKTAILQEIAERRFLAPHVKAAWRRTLEATTLTDRDDESLTGLRGRMILESVRGASFEVGRSASISALVGSVSTLIDIRVQARAAL